MLCQLLHLHFGMKKVTICDGGWDWLPQHITMTMACSGDKDQCWIRHNLTLSIRSYWNKAIASIPCFEPWEREGATTASHVSKTQHVRAIASTTWVGRRSLDQKWFIDSRDIPGRLLVMVKISDPSRVGTIRWGGAMMGGDKSAKIKWELSQSEWMVC